MLKSVKTGPMKSICREKNSSLKEENENFETTPKLVPGSMVALR